MEQGCAGIFIHRSIPELFDGIFKDARTDGGQTIPSNPSATLLQRHRQPESVAVITERRAEADAH